MRAELQATRSRVWPVALQMRSVHHVLRPIRVFALPATGALDVEGTCTNLTAAGLEGQVRELQVADARRLSDAFGEQRFDAVITNPPYGMRMGRGLDFDAFYEEVLSSVGERLHGGGRLVVLVDRHAAFLRALERVGGFRLDARRSVETRGVRPTLYALERLF